MSRHGALSVFEYLPPGSQIAIASREEPGLPLARWRANGFVRELGTGDLRLEAAEAGLLLEAAGVELAANELFERSEVHQSELQFLMRISYAVILLYNTTHSYRLPAVLT